MNPSPPFPWAGLSILLVLGLITTLIYFLPTVIAWRRGHVNRLAILLCNALFGWTFIGWGLTLVWSFTSAVRAPRRVRLNFDYEGAGSRSIAG